MCDEGTLTLARAEAANTENHGSTAEERATAEAWLELARREEQPEHGTNGAAVKPTPGRVSARASRVPPKSDVSRETAVSVAGQRTVTGRRVNGRAATRAIRLRPKPHESSSQRAGLALEQIHAVTHQQRRILHGTVVLDCALKAEALDLRMREAIADLRADITEAAHAIGVIVYRREVLACNYGPNRRRSGQRFARGKVEIGAGSRVRR